MREGLFSKSEKAVERNEAFQNFEKKVDEKVVARESRNKGTFFEIAVFEKKKKNQKTRILRICKKTRKKGFLFACWVRAFLISPAGVTFSGKQGSENKAAGVTRHLHRAHHVSVLGKAEFSDFFEFFPRESAL